MCLVLASSLDSVTYHFPGNLWDLGDNQFCLSCGHPQREPVDRPLLAAGALQKKNLKMGRKREDLEGRK